MPVPRIWEQSTQNVVPRKNPNFYFLKLPEEPGSRWRGLDCAPSGVSCICGHGHGLWLGLLCVAQVLLSMASQPPGPLCCSLSSEEPSASYMGAQNDQALFMPRVEVPAHHSLALALV